MILKISTIIFSGRKVMANNLIAQIFIVDFFKKIKLLRIFSLFNYPLLFAHPSLELYNSTQIFSCLFGLIDKISLYLLPKNTYL